MLNGSRMPMLQRKEVTAMIRPNVSILSLSMNFSGDDKFNHLEIYDVTGVDYLVNMADE